MKFAMVYASFVSTATVAFSASIMAAAAPHEALRRTDERFPLDTEAFALAVNKGRSSGSRSRIEYWKAQKVVGGFNDYSRILNDCNTIEEMYNACYDFCMKYACHSFDLVPYKRQCNLDTSSEGEAVPLSSYEKSDVGAAYVKISDPVHDVDSIAVTSTIPTSVAPKPTSTKAATGPQCFGFGLQWNNARPFLIDTLPSNHAVHVALTKACGNDAECGKWYTCANSCGALAVPPDAKQAKRQMQPSIQYAPNRADAETAALDECQKRLTEEGIQAGCEVVASFCVPAKDA